MRFALKQLALGAFAVTSVLGLTMRDKARDPNVLAIRGVDDNQPVSPNIIIVKNMDEKSRTLHFRSEGPVEMLEFKMIGHDITMKGGETLHLEMPRKWKGNFRAFVVGDTRTLGVLAEITFVEGGHTFYDASSIVAQDDQDGVHKVYPFEKEGSMAGCELYPCANAYSYPTNDVNTRATSDTKIVVELYSVSK
ncbi:hypothetical protein NHQ30_001831 [Ciborinia camelliae]|nr:hypothetical protein NHQ30_001831 [Ciborinia camelliae]